MKRILLGCLFALLFTGGICVETTETSSNTEVTTHISSVETTSEVFTTTTPLLTTFTPEPETTTATSEPVSTTTVSSPEPVTSTTTIVTTNVPVTTKAPEPIPKPSKGSWNVTQNNVTCIRAELAILFVIPVEKEKMYITLSPNATWEDGSDCNLSNTTQKLVLTDDNIVFTMIFEKAAGKVYVTNMTLNYTTPEESELFHNDDKKFSVSIGHSYQCRTQEDISLANVTMEVMDIHVQAFGGKDDKGFTTAEECEADDKVGDAVPIAVACALAALIIVVLIAYLVGRRRSRQRGYQSV